MDDVAERGEAPERLDAPAVTRRRALRDQATTSDTGKAAGLAIATLANNAIQLVFTIVVTRVLGATDYGALAAITSAFVILLVGGQAVQAAAAREVALGRLGDRGALHAVVRSWMRTLALATVGLALLGAAIQTPLAALIGVDDHAWAAAAILPTGGLWLLLSLQRGVLQGLHAYKPVAISLVLEAVGRLAFGVVLAVALGVTGAFLGTPLCFVLTAAVLAGVLERRLGEAVTPDGGTHRLRALVSDGKVAIGGLALLALLQNVDVIIARHVLGHDRAGSYAVAAVAAKAVVWVAIGVGLQLLPQATARAAAGEDPRPVLWRALGVLAVVATPALLIFLVAGRLVLRVGFGEDTTDAAPALPVLALAMTLLAVAYLTVQYLLALHRRRFLWALLAVAAVEVVALLVGPTGLVGYATVVLVAQAVAATAMLVLAFRVRRDAEPGTGQYRAPTAAGSASSSATSSALSVAEAAPRFSSR